MGAWIEIADIHYDCICQQVAPHVGAWIEILRAANSLQQWLVAPHVGAWIEILLDFWIVMKPKSHPTWVRGLKFAGRYGPVRGRGSHPTWVRGLKYEIPAA